MAKHLIDYRIALDKAVRRARFYWRGGLAYFVLPTRLLRWQAERRLRKLSADERAEAEHRARFYCPRPLSEAIEAMGEEAVQQASFGIPLQGANGECLMLSDFTCPPRNGGKKFSTYFYDLIPSVRCFPQHWLMRYLFGDITTVEAIPTIVKSRPIGQGNENSTVMKLDSMRHFMFLSDPTPWRAKKDAIVSRNVVRQPHRIRLLEQWFGHPKCNFGQVNPDVQQGHPEWIQPFMPMSEQLSYKFIACVEGHDVATNLKWVMSSNSLAVMPRPRYETWFMESQLRPGYHYVEVKDDYSDLIAQMDYYCAHPDEAEAIIRHAHEYVQQFQNRRLEQATEYLTMKRYLGL